MKPSELRAKVRKTRKEIVRTPKQDLQSAYSWHIAQMMCAIGILERTNRFLLENSSNPWKFFVPNEEFVRSELKLAYLEAKKKLEINNG